MGLLPAEEVPDFFVLEDLVYVRWDDAGYPIYRGDRIDVSIDDIIVREGPRSPDFAAARRNPRGG